MNNNLFAVKNEICKVLRGKDDIIDMVLCAILAKGHILLEVEAYAQADILALIRLIEEDVGVPGSLVDLLLLPVGDAVALFLQRLHPSLQFLAGHTFIIHAIEI